METYKKNIRKILAVIIILVAGYGIVSNIEHLIYVNKTYNYDFENGVEIDSIKSSIETIKKNLSTIETMKSSSLSDEQLSSFKEYLNDVIDNSSKYEFVGYTNKHNNLKQKDLMEIMLNYEKLNYSNLIDTYNNLAVSDSSLATYKKEFVEHVYYMLLSSNTIYQKLYDNYKYGNLNHFDSTLSLDANMVMESFVEKLNTIKYVSNLVVATAESGEVSE